MTIRIALLIAIAFLLGGQNANAAKCKYEKDEVNPDTNVKTLQTAWDQLTSTWMQNTRPIDGHISLLAVGDTHTLRVLLDFSEKPRKGPSDYELKDKIVVEEGAALLIMMKDKSVTKLTALREVRVNAYSLPPEQHGYQTNTYTVRAVINVEYALDAEAIAALKSQPATTVRVTAADRNYDIEINKKSFEDFQDAFACMQ